MRSGDIPTCGAHGAGFNCAIAASKSWLTLLWCWGPSGCSFANTSQKVNLFNIYEVDNGKHTFITSTNPDPSDGNLPTAGFVPTPPGGFTNQCYAVTAVSGKVESGTSNAVCLGNGTMVSNSESLQSTQSGSRYQHFRHQGLTVPLSWPLDNGLNCGTCFGYFHYTTGGSDITNVVDNAYWRAYYLFDTSSLLHRYINQATLVLSFQSYNGCLAEIAAADSDWWDNQNMIGGEFVTAQPAVNGQFVSIDVTDIVRSWANGGPNNGFVLRGPNENNDARDNDQCRDGISSASLNVTHS
jgi:hypothetical protein